MVKIYIFWQKPPYSSFLITFIGIKNTNQLETQFLGGCKMPCLPSFFPQNTSPATENHQFQLFMQKTLFRLVSPGCFCANKRAAGPKSFDSRPQIKTLGTTQVENPQRAGFCPKKELQGGGAPKRPRIGQKGLKITISARFGSNHRFFLIKVSKKHQITPKRRSDVIGHPWQGSPASSAP